jgi:glutaredoxin-related protein
MIKTGERRVLTTGDFVEMPEIICLCGSTRFTDVMLLKQWELTKKGKIVVSWCAVPNWYHSGPHVGDAEGVKEIVDEVHKRKIDLADRVFVINFGGYIGESTRSEIEYAKKLGMLIDYLEEL